MKYRPKTKPFKHQARATLAAVRQGNHAFLMDPGTGKTKAALDAIAIQALRGKVKKVLVLCPLIAIGVWEDQIDEHFPSYARVETVDEEWDVNKPAPGVLYTPLRHPTQFYLLNYDKCSQRKRTGKGYVYPYLKEIEAWDPDLIVLDESHRCKRAGAVRSQALWRLVRRLRKRRTDSQPFVWLLTGTPNPKGYIDIFAQFRIMDEDIFGTSKADFEEEHCVYGKGRRKWTIIKYRKKKEIIRKIRAHSTVAAKHKVLDLPPQMWQNIPVKLPPKIKRAYLEMANDLVTTIEGETLEASNLGVKRLRLLQLTGGFTTAGKRLHEAKLRGAEELLADLLEQGQSVVVYARFLPEVAALEAICSKLGFRCVAITGATKSRDRTTAIRDFQQSTGPSALVFQVETGSLAITLTKAQEVLFYSLPDAWDTYWQCINRVHRIGQTGSVRYRHLVAPGTIDVSQVASLRKKSDMHGELMRTPRKFLFGL